MPTEAVSVNIMYYDIHLEMYIPAIIRFNVCLN